MPQPPRVWLMAAGVRLSPSICSSAAMAARRSSGVDAAGRRANSASRPSLGVRWQQGTAHAPAASRWKVSHQARTEQFPQGSDQK